MYDELLIGLKMMKDMNGKYDEGSFSKVDVLVLCSSILVIIS